MAKKVCVAARAFAFSPNATAARGTATFSSAVNLLSDSTRLSITCAPRRRAAGHMEKVHNTLCGNSAHARGARCAAPRSDARRGGGGGREHRPELLCTARRPAC